MMQKETITMNCLFLHDTPAADLEREQRRLRALYQEAFPDSSLPFSVLPPFCLAPVIPAKGKLTVGGCENREGWIVLPVSGSDEEGTREWQIRDCPIFPGFPPLPAHSAFILGFAGKAADGLIAGMKDADARPFSVNVWFEAAVTLTAEYDEGVFYGAFHEIGSGHWHKARK